MAASNGLPVLENGVNASGQSDGCDCDDNDDGEYFVEKVIGHRLNDDNQWEFLVKWLHYDAPTDNTWEPLAHMEHSQQAMGEYARSLRAILPQPAAVDGQQPLDALLRQPRRSALRLDAFNAAFGDQLIARATYSLNLGVLKSAQEAALREWERVLNEKCAAAGEAAVTVVNEADAEGPPDAFEFVTDNVFHRDVTADRTYKILSCSCKNNCVAPDPTQPRKRPRPAALRPQLDGSSGSCSSSSSECGGDTNGGGGGESSACCQRSDLYDDLRLAPGCFVYDGERRIRHKYLAATRLIIECNSGCACAKSLCPSRVVQNMRQVPLTLFRTKGRGWGVRSEADIPAGTFVGCYVGEIIDASTAEKRAHEQKVHSNGASYIYDLDHMDECTYAVDAMYYGNLSRFFNHSCSPNLRVYNVWTECQLQMLPSLAFFTCRFVPKGKELCFDYAPASGLHSSYNASDDCEGTETGETDGGKHGGAMQTCLCGSTKCRGQLWL